MIALTWPWRAYWPRARDVATVALAGAAAFAPCGRCAMPVRRSSPRRWSPSPASPVFGAVLYLLDLGGVIRPAAAKVSSGWAGAAVAPAQGL